MKDIRNAVALRNFTNGDTSHLRGALIEGMAPNQFDDFVAVGLVRAATDKDIAADQDPAPIPGAEEQPAA